MYSVSSCWLTFFFFFFWFSSVSTQEVPCYHLFPERAQPLPGLLPTWPRLASSCPLLSRSITFVPGEQVKCLPACCLSASSAPAFRWNPLLRTFPECSPSSSPWYPAWALVWGVACDSTEGGQPFGHRGRGPTPFLLTQDNSYATWPPKQDRSVLVNKRRALRPRGCCSLLTDLSQSRFE